MLEVMVNGCYGKMGQIVCDLIEQSENFIKHSQELGIDCDSLIEMIDNSLISEVDKRSGENRL